MNFKKFAGLFFVMLWIMAFAQQSSAADPWETLFNGRDFEGWKLIGSKGNVWVEDGAFVCHPVSNTTEHTFICTKKKYEDFIFEAEAKIEGPLHTGFILRSAEVKYDTSKVNLSGYQVKIDPTERRWTGGIFDEIENGIEWYYPLKESEEARSAFKFNEWNKYRIEAIGDSIKIWVNDIPTCNLVHDKYSKGCIAIKIHWLGNSPELEKVLMRFRDMRIITKNPNKFKMPMNYPVINLKTGKYLINKGE